MKVCDILPSTDQLLMQHSQGERTESEYEAEVWALGFA